MVVNQYYFYLSGTLKINVKRKINDEKCLQSVRFGCGLAIIVIVITFCSSFCYFEFWLLCDAMSRFYLALHACSTHMKSVPGGHSSGWGQMCLQEPRV
jgi:hypothetical protein